MKKEFLDRLRIGLCDLSEIEINDVINFYNDLIESKIENGYSEEDAILSLGDINICIKNVLSDHSNSYSESKISNDSEGNIHIDDVKHFEGIYNLDIISDWLNIEIIGTSKNEVVVEYNEKNKYQIGFTRLGNDILRIKVESNMFSAKKSNVCKIYIPSNLVENIWYKGISSCLSIKDIFIERLNTNLSSGKLTINDSEISEIFSVFKTGSFEAININEETRIASRKVYIKTISGSISFDGLETPDLKIINKCGSVKLKNIKTDNLNVRCDTGKINIDKLNAIESELFVSIGGIKCTNIYGNRGIYKIDDKSKSIISVRKISSNYNDETLTKSRYMKVGCNIGKVSLGFIGD